MKLNKRKTIEKTIKRKIWFTVKESIKLTSFFPNDQEKIYIQIEREKKRTESTKVMKEKYHCWPNINKK